jgi:RNA polymerase sigma factor (sigma-70 family)
MHAADQSDAQLVTASLAGNHQAFRRIVERYQTLICSLAYCATGSLNQSEELSQATFVTAWKQLTQLREPSKLRPWLCGIARFVIGTELRRQRREPVCGAEPLEEAEAAAAVEPSPPERAISQEEAAILWRSIAGIPEAYREPLVLFYREHRSIAEVAKSLDVSEDAVKQRLSRGRRLLHEQVLAFVEGALERSSPGATFTLGVMAALPLMATTTEVSAAGAAAKAGATGKAAGGLAVLKAALGFAPFMVLGALVGLKMGRDTGGSLHQREVVARFWRVVVAGLAACIILPLVLLVLASVTGVVTPNMRPQALAVLTSWLGILYVVVMAAVGFWLWQRRKVPPSEIAKVGQPDGGKKSSGRWVVPATIAAGVLFVALLFDTNWKVGRLNPGDVQAMVNEHKDVEFAVIQYQNAHRSLDVRLHANGQLLKYAAPADDATLAWLAQKGIRCPTYVQGRDFEILGWPGRLLPVLSLFIVTAGVAVLWRSRGQRKAAPPAAPLGNHEATR